MGWKLKDWTGGGYRAEREDGELVFIYRRPSWGTGLAGLGAYYELRSRGRLIGRISSESGWRPLIRAEWLAETGRLLNETDLLDITAAINLIN